MNYDPPAAGDQCDRVIDPENMKQYIAWGVGGLGETAFRHFVNAKSKTHLPLI